MSCKRGRLPLDAQRRPPARTFPRTPGDASPEGDPSRGHRALASLSLARNGCALPQVASDPGGGVIGNSPCTAFLCPSIRQSMKERSPAFFAFALPVQNGQ